MISAARLAWLQLRRQKARLAVALAGVGFAVVLMFMQLGFRDALYRSALNAVVRLEADLVLVNPRYTWIGSPGTIPRRRIFQALGFPGVATVAPIYCEIVDWKNPATNRTRRIFAVGLDPARGGLRLDELTAPFARIRYPDVVFFDVLSRPEFGPVPAMFRKDGPIVTEANRHQVTIEGLFRMGTSFGIDGSIVTSDLTFLQLFPSWRAGALSLGLVRLLPEADSGAVRDALDAALPEDVEVLTRAQLMDREMAFWAETTPIGYVFMFGVVMGVVVGAIIVYQILFADITDHLPEYATLKAMGYTNRYLAGVVLIEAVLLAGLGFVPGAAVCAWFYRVTAAATGLPMTLTPARAALILGLTVAMCALSALIAMRKLRSADPAEVF